MAMLLFKFGSALRAPVEQQGCALQGGCAVKFKKKFFEKKKNFGLPLYTSLSYRNLTYLSQT